MQGHELSGPVAEGVVAGDHSPSTHATHTSDLRPEKQPNSTKLTRTVPFWLFALTTVGLVALHFTPELVNLAEQRYGPLPLLRQIEDAMGNRSLRMIASRAIGSDEFDRRLARVEDALSRSPNDRNTILSALGVEMSESARFDATLREGFARLDRHDSQLVELRDAQGKVIEQQNKFVEVQRQSLVFQTEMRDQIEQGRLEQQRLAGLVTSLNANIIKFEDKLGQDSALKGAISKMEADAQEFRKEFEAAQKLVVSSTAEQIANRIRENVALGEARLSAVAEPIISRIGAVEASIKATSESAKKAQTDHRSISVLPVLLLKMAQSNGLDKVDAERLELYFADDAEFSRSIVTLKAAIAANPKPRYVLRDEFKEKLSEASAIARSESMSWFARAGLWVNEVGYFIGFSEKPTPSISELALLAGLEKLDRGSLPDALFELEPLGKETKAFLGKWYAEAKQRLVLDEAMARIQDRLYATVDRTISAEAPKTK